MQLHFIYHLLSILLVHNSSIQLLGVLLDITGAYYLSRAFIFKSPLDIKFETYGTGNSRLHMSFGMSGNLFMSFYTQGVEARIGFGLLFSGFLFQAIGIIWPSYYLPIYITIAIWICSTLISYILRCYLNNPERVKEIHDRRE
jgi:hypothetical protein